MSVHELKTRLVPPENSVEFELLGLRQGVYYVRGFLDINGNDRHDIWEPHGVARDKSWGANYEYWVNYRVGAFDLSQRQTVSGATVLIRDRDTDSDNVPDAWEQFYFSTLAHLGSHDADNDGLTILEEYACDFDPFVADADGDGASDLLEMAIGSDPTSFADRGFTIEGFSFDESGRPLVQWQVYANGADVDVRFTLEFTTNLLTGPWVPVGASTYEGLSDGQFGLSDMVTTNEAGFYRVRADLE